MDLIGEDQRIIERFLQLIKVQIMSKKTNPVERHFLAQLQTMVVSLYDMPK